MKSQTNRTQLSECIVGEEAKKAVRTAPVAAVFLADTMTMEESQFWRLQDHWLRTTDVSEAYIDGDFRWELRRASLGFAKPWGKYIFAPLMQKYLSFKSWFSVMPQPVGAQAWALKQTAFFTDHLALTATAHRVESYIIEDLSSRHILSTFDIPSRFTVANVVALGYKAEDPSPLPSRRFLPTNVFCEEELTTYYGGIRPGEETFADHIIHEEGSEEPEGPPPRIELIDEGLGEEKEEEAIQL